MNSQTLVLPDFPRPEVARTLSPNGRAHWTVKRKAQMNVVNVVTVYAIKSGLLRMQGMVTLRMIWTYPVRRPRDPDNLTSGTTKAILDCLVKGQWLEGDTTDLLRIEPVEVRVEKGRRALELRFEVGAP